MKPNAFRLPLHLDAAICSGTSAAWPAAASAAAKKASKSAFFPIMPGTYDGGAAAVNRAERNEAAPGEGGFVLGGRSGTGPDGRAAAGGRGRRGPGGGLREDHGVLAAAELGGSEGALVAEAHGRARLAAHLAEVEIDLLAAGAEDDLALALLAVHRHVQAVGDLAILVLEPEGGAPRLALPPLLGGQVGAEHHARLVAQLEGRVLRERVEVLGGQRRRVSRLHLEALPLHRGLRLDAELLHRN